MKEFKPTNSHAANKSSDFVPIYASNVGSGMVCCCGYELLKESENTLRCSGGGHQYKLPDKSAFAYDKFGNVLLEQINPLPK